MLRHVARSIVEGARLGDIVVRYGGEEFVVLLSGVDVAAARSVAERIRASVAEPIVDRPNITASVGVALRTERGELRAIGGTRRQGDVLRESQRTGPGRRRRLTVPPR